jgi:hypothetical protein
MNSYVAARKVPDALHQSLPSPRNSNLSCDTSSDKLKETKDCKLHHTSVLADAVFINWQHEGSYYLIWAPHHAGL